MKSDELFATDEPEEEELPPWEAPFADDGPMGHGGGAPDEDGAPGFDPVEGLEAEMERRLERKHVRGKTGDARRTGSGTPQRRAWHLVEGVPKLRYERLAAGLRPRDAGAELPLGRRLPGR